MSTCPCGEFILADTEDWPVPLCYNCCPNHIIEANEKLIQCVDFYSHVDRYSGTKKKKAKILQDKGMIARRVKDSVDPDGLMLRDAQRPR